MGAMSELPPEDTHDVIHRGGQVVAVVVPIEEYRQLRLAQEEERINEEFAAAYADHLARKESGTVQYVSHEEARRRLGMPGQ
jgi:PHD/YefM family antitoxin component YafN of YafNO toxin-antitoxin module